MVRRLAVVFLTSFALLCASAAATGKVSHKGWPTIDGIFWKATGDADQAREILAMAPAGAKDPDLDSVRAALELAAVPPSELTPFEERLAANPDDHEARFELANALAGQGRLDEAVDQLLTIFQKDRDWNEQAARKQLVKIFEAAGPTSDVAKTGRRRLSSLMFS